MYISQPISSASWVAYSGIKISQFETNPSYRLMLN